MENKSKEKSQKTVKNWVLLKSSNKSMLNKLNSILILAHYYHLNIIIKLITSEMSHQMIDSSLKKIFLLMKLYLLLIKRRLTKKTRNS